MIFNLQDLLTGKISEHVFEGMIDYGYRFQATQNNLKVDSNSLT